MAREEFPINPAIVTWARERAGYTLVEARSKFRRIEAWEIGESPPVVSSVGKHGRQIQGASRRVFLSQPARH